MLIQVRIVETATSKGQCDVALEASSPSHAADMIARAHRKAQKVGSNVITLPDGQGVFMDRGPAEIELALTLLDAAGQEVEPIEVPKLRRGRAKQR